jgi:tetratricopeptide (TPR) repeat protein
MQRPVQRFGLLCGACMVLACAAVRHAPPMPMPLAPIGADEAYLMGRQHQLARSSADAVRLYRQALLADPQHINARNGLATALAEQGNFSGAVVIWQDLIAQLQGEAGPGAAYLFSNLGYAYFLAGQYAAAQQAQERACLLDPGNPHAWQRLANTLDRAGDAARALHMQRQALALLKHDVHADVALAGGSAVIDSPEDGWARVTLSAGADGLLTLQRTGAQAAGAGTPAPATASLEISNGNGVPGMARAFASRVRDPALRLVRLTNADGFGVRRTRIEYQPALRAMAARLAQQVQPDAVLVEAPGGARTGLRLVLGHNAAKPGAAI